MGTSSGPRKTRRGVLGGLAGGAATALAAGPAAAQSDGGGGGGGDGQSVAPYFDGWVADVDGGYLDARGQDSVTVRVGAQGNGGTFAFGPKNLWIDPGTTVTFRWVSDNHNVLPEEQPDGAGWEGHEPIENTGFTYEHTFETQGMFKYYCEPHLPLGMKGGVAVGDDVPTRPIGAGDGGGGFALPEAPGLGVFGIVFALTAGAAMTVLGAEAAGAVNRRGGVRGPEPETVGETPEAAVEEPVREIGHEGFDPWGTLRLILLYFAVLVVMWIFMYFVEFLGNGPTVIG
jgi:halocyanin-like protein